MKDKGLKGKDLITIGIFAALFFALSLLFHLPSGISTLVWFLTPALSAIICATPYLILCAKIKKPFAVLIMNIVVGLIFLATGQFHILLPTAFLATGIIAEALRAAGKYKKFFFDSLAYVFVSLSMTASPLPLWVDKDNFIQQIKDFGTSQSVLDEIMKFTSPGMLFVIYAAAIAGAVIGILLAKKLFHKHFIRAGKV